jgi:hypothetical protein
VRAAARRTPQISMLPQIESEVNIQQGVAPAQYRSASRRLLFHARKRQGLILQ